MSNIIDKIQLSGVQYTLSAQTSGGTTYTAGRAIDITNDTISLDLPISAGTGSGSIIENNPDNIASGEYSHAEGNRTSGASYASHAEGSVTKASGIASHAEGRSTTASGEASHAEGRGTTAQGHYSHAEGDLTTASGTYGAHAEGYLTKASGEASHAEGSYTSALTIASHAEGNFTKTTNNYEHASGQFNNSVYASTTFGDSGNTLFSVGNGTADDARHNAFEVRQNADIYITLNGQDVKLQDYLGGSSGNPTVELTQAEYDALVSAGTVAADTYYIITDATPIDVSTFVTSGQMTSAITQATSGKVDSSSIVSSVTSASTDSEIPTAKAVYDAIPTGGTGGVSESTFSAYTAATDSRLSEDEEVTAAALNALNESLSGKQDTLVSSVNIKTINNESILGSGNIDIQGGGGKAVSGGTNISITTGETADTINCTLPITTAIDNTSLNFGFNTINSEYSYSFGNGNTVGRGRYDGNYSMAVGLSNTTNKEAQFVTGYSNKLLNFHEFGSGRFNNSVSGSSTFGDSGNTLFSVGNGTANNARHNAFEIRQNGDIYITSGSTDIKLQDYLGSTIEISSAITSGDTNAVAGGAVYNKFDEVETVTARALNDLNEKINALIEANEVVARALNDLNDRITALENA